MDLVESILKAKERQEAPVIAEIKRTIPKLAAEEGRLKDERPAALLAQMYQNGRATGISLVTEKEHFGGQPEVDVPAVLRSTSLPLLIKDFNRSKEHIDFYSRLIRGLGREYLSRVTLLLTIHWLGEKLPAMLSYVHDMGMLALVETRNPGDLRFLKGLRQAPKLVGINNKNIDELERGEDIINLTPGLIAQYRQLAKGSLLISQSAHKRPEDVCGSIAAGADAVLVGTAFMVSAEPGKTVADFVHSLGEKK